MKDDAAPDLPVRTALEDRLITLIAERGPISIGDYMADALGHAQYGYYTTQDPFGKAGDFTTSPEISQVFGELVGAWLVHAWKEIGAPSLFNLVEFGPGRGTLMGDILRVAALRPGFLKAARIFLIESSGRLRVKQQRALAPHHAEIDWTDNIDDIPDAPTLMVANEFFDCLPIRQFVKAADTDDAPWRERLVGLSGTGAARQLCYVLSDETYQDRPGMPAGAAPEAVFEECSAGAALAAAMAERLKVRKGRALIIDYGHGRSGFGDTFQAVKRHDVWHPLVSPGLADVTAHVDFAALARAARAAGARVDGPVRQGDFLSRLGIANRVEALVAAAATEGTRDDIRSGALRLISPDGMGSLFKVLSISSPDLPPAPGFP